MSESGELKEVDVTDWIFADDEQIGTKPKFWLHDPVGQRWLWKEATHNVTRDGSRYRKGEDWAEKASCELAYAIGVPASSVELAVHEGRYGTVSLSFAADPAAELQLGNEMLAGLSEDHLTSADRNDPGYTLDAVYEALTNVTPPRPDPVLKTAGDWFAGYLVLDAWIGNTDRHHKNWGVIAAGQERPTLAPSFDHASSLGFLLSDEERVTRLRTGDVGRAPETWAERASTPFATAAHPCEVALDALARIDRSAAAVWLQRLDQARDAPSHLFPRFPPHRMSEAARDFALRLLVHNHRRLLSEAPSRIGM